MSHVGPEPQIGELVQRELDQKQQHTSALIAPHIDEVYPLHSFNFIFLYDPADDMFYVAPTDKFHIDLINYIIGVKKHTNPDDSYLMLDKYVLGV